MRWNLREEESYQRCAAQLGGLAYVDRILGAVLDALSLDPRGFYPTGVENIRIAKTRLARDGAKIIPAMTLRYRIEPPNTVCLLHTELALPDEMEISDDPF